MRERLCGVSASVCVRDEVCVRLRGKVCVCASASLCERFVRLHLCEREGLCVWVREREKVCVRGNVCLHLCVWQCAPGYRTDKEKMDFDR